MNQAEAETKVCPLTLARDTAPGKCVGSACMAWCVTGKEYTGRDVVVKLPGGGGRIEMETRDTGECGMVPSQ